MNNQLKRFKLDSLLYLFISNHLIKIINLLFFNYFFTLKIYL